MRNSLRLISLFLIIFLLIGVAIPAQSVSAASGAITSPKNGDTVPNCTFPVMGTLSGLTTATIVVTDTDGSIPEFFPVTASGGNFTTLVTWTDDYQSLLNDFPEPGQPLIITLQDSGGNTLSSVTVILRPDCTFASSG